MAHWLLGNGGGAQCLRFFLRRLPATVVAAGPCGGTVVLARVHVVLREKQEHWRDEDAR